MRRFVLVAVLALAAACGGSKDCDDDQGTSERSDLNKCLDMCDARYSLSSCGYKPGMYAGGEATRLQAGRDCGRACAAGEIDPQSVQCFFEGDGCSAARIAVCFD